LIHISDHEVEGHLVLNVDLIQALDSEWPTNPQTNLLGEFDWVSSLLANFLNLLQKSSWVIKLLNLDIFYIESYIIWEYDFHPNWKELWGWSYFLHVLVIALGQSLY
jgi:hypothetical protein